MRSMVTWQPMSALTRFDRELDEMLNRARSARPHRAGTGFAPAIDIVDDGADVLIRMELAGVDIEHDLDLAVERGSLVVRGLRRPATPENPAQADATEEITNERVEPAEHGRDGEGGGPETAGRHGRVTVSEIRSGAFHRAFVLPDHVTADDIEADYDRGILSIRVRNVVPPVPEPRRIAVSTSR